MNHSYLGDTMGPFYMTFSRLRTPSASLSYKVFNRFREQMLPSPVFCSPVAEVYLNALRCPISTDSSISQRFL
jgi:hypothetical protein